MTAEEMLAQLPKLDPVELERFRESFERQWVHHSGLEVPGIEKTEGVCGGSARIARTRIPVWLLVSMRRRGAENRHFFESFAGLNSSDLEHAWSYAAAHPTEIDREILENESDEE